MYLIPRTDYLDFLKNWRAKPLIKVVSGVRRCGKSTLFILYQHYLKTVGVEDDNIIQINFEQPDFMNISDADTLYDYLKPKLTVSGMKYIFLDEVQHVAHFEKIADALNTLPDVDLYITGSNGYLMSGELATLLTGRYVELKMLPLSFKEYIDGYQHLYPSDQLSKLQMYNNYLQYGSFPYVVYLHNNSELIEQYLDGIYSSIAYRDIETRLKITDKLILQRIINFIFDGIGSPLSIRNIANTLTSNGFKISPTTVERYLKGILDSLLVYKAPRFDIHGKQQLRTNDKYYIVDIGLRYHLLAGNKADRGHILENVVYLELLRRGYKVSVGVIENNEIDFVAQKGNKLEYYQISQSVIDDETLKRELRPFDKVRDHYPKFLLTLDEIGSNDNYNGIQQLNVIDWLLK